MRHNQVLRVLHVVPAYYPATYWGGPIFTVYGLNRALAARPDVQLKVLTTDSAGPQLGNCLKAGTLDRPSLYPDYTVEFSRRIAGHSASLELLLKLPGLIRWSDVVHLSAVYSFPTIPTLLLCRIWRRPVVWSMHGALLSDQQFPNSKRRLLKRLWLGLCNALVLPDLVTLHVTSHEEAAASASRISTAHVAVIPHGVEALEALPERTYLPDGKMRLLFIGRLHPIKGIEHLLDAIMQLDDPSITLSIYGDGDPQYLDSLKQHAARLGVLDRMVSFCGPVNGPMKTNAFLSSDVGVFPSFSENFGMVVAETLAHGLPVIASRKTPWRSVLDKGCGLWVENDPESLARAIKSIRRMNISEMGRRGFDWMREEFGWPSVAREVRVLYGSVKELARN